MVQKNLALVTGANGHLGNNLVRLLIKKGVPVRAAVRNIKNTAPFAGLECEVVQADITNMQSLTTALQGIQTFYAVCAAFKLWAKDPKKEIYDVNIEGTRLQIEAAAQAVRKTHCLCKFYCCVELHQTSDKRKQRLQSRSQGYVL